MANKLILVVEDNERNRKLGERRPSLVLMDIRLPGTDGVEALGRLKAAASTRDIPVMAMTASVMSEDRQRITSAGFDAFQGRPIKVKEFLAAVEQLLERHRR